MTMSLALDVFVAFLLVITIGLAAILNHRLGRLRRDRSELEKLTAEFRDATSKAEESVNKLKVSTDSLQERIDLAQNLKEDLSFLIDRSGSAADRLEGQIPTARKPATPTNKVTQPTAQPKRWEGNTAGPIALKSQAERDLLKALAAKG